MHLAVCKHCINIVKTLKAEYSIFLYINIIQTMKVDYSVLVYVNIIQPTQAILLNKHYTNNEG